MTVKNLGRTVVGLDRRVPLLDGRTARYVNYDNAGSTPPLGPVMKKVTEFMPWYSNVHRGTGFKSLLASWAFDEARRMIAQFVNADNRQSVIFCKNTTEAINKLAARFRCPAAGQLKPMVLTTMMEHHSNDLPWRKVADVLHVRVTPEGMIDNEDLRRKLADHRGRIQLLAVTGASNVSGYINPYHEYARWAHEAGAQIVVDAAQLAAHRPIDVKPSRHPEHIDYLVFSAHKMYAPFGVGVLVADRSAFDHGSPENVGGGTVDIVNLEGAYWKDLPDREEAGTPVIVGVIALAEAVKLLRQVGFRAIIKHEAELTAQALKVLNAMPRVTVYGDRDPGNARNRLGVISFNVDGVDHALTAAVLGYEGGIGVRDGCFCAQPYVKCLLGVNADQAQVHEQMILSCNRAHLPGTVRISFGIYNTRAEIDHFARVLRTVVDGTYRGKYLLDQRSGQYYPKGFKLDYVQYFDF